MPTFFGDADAQALIDASGGVPVTVGATTANGLRRVRDDQESLESGPSFLTSTEVSVIVRTTTFAGLLTRGAAITVEGVVYKIVRAEQIEDGGLTRVYCAK